MEYPIKLNLNIKYKRMMEKYKEFEIKSKHLNRNIFQVLLKTARIKYHNNEGIKINNKLNTYNINDNSNNNNLKNILKYSNLKNTKTIVYKNVALKRNV